MLKDRATVLVDPCVPDTFATGRTAAEFIAGNVRLTFYVDRISPLGEHERVVVSRLVLPLEVARPFLAYQSPAGGDEAVIFAAMDPDGTAH